MHVIIRTAVPEDAAKIARIHVDAWRSAYAGIVPDSYLARLSTEKRQKTWASTIARSPASIRVAVSDDQTVLGWATFGRSRDEDDQEAGELYAIYLDPIHWGKGIGKALLQDAVIALVNLEFTSMTLWVLEENLRARNFYEKAGFVFDGTAKTLVFDGKALIEWRYRRNISSDD